MKVLEPGSSTVVGAPVSDVVIGSGELWLPPKELYELMEVVCSEAEPTERLIEDVDRILTRHSAEFASLFDVKPPNQVDRQELKKCSTEGAFLKGLPGRRVISYSIVNEAILLSDMFRVNEFLALDLLTAAENEQENYPGWPRGLIAVHMYYEGRFWLIYTLNTMIRLCPGRTWQSRVHPTILQLFRRTLNSVFREDMMDRLTSLLEDFNTDKQMGILEANLALGDWRHRRKVKSLLCSIKEGIANVIFCYGAQREVRWAEIKRVLDYLKTQVAPDQRRMTKGDVTLIASIIYSIEYNMSPPEVNLNFGRSLQKYLSENQTSFKCFELWDVFKLALLIDTHKLPSDSGRPGTPSVGGGDSSVLGGTGGGGASTTLEEKQSLVDEVDFEFTRNLFGYLRWEVFAHPEFYTEDENVAKVFHGFLTDFIIYMPLKIKEMKYRSEETAKTILVCQDQGIQPVIPDVPEYESFLDCLGEFYEHDKFELGSYYFLGDVQYLALSKLVRSCCLESPALFLSSMRFLNGVTTGNPTAMFELVRQAGHNASLEHFFDSILNYLKAFGGNEEGKPLSDRFIMNPMEIRGICAYLCLVQSVCERHESACNFFTTQKPNWIRTMMQVAKVPAVPREIRASMLTTCAAMIGNDSHSPEVVTTLWDMLYQARLIDPGTADVGAELDEKETRLESYSLTVGMLKLIKTLVSARFRQIEFQSLEGYSVHPTYDNGAIFPYINFVVDAVFLKIPFRIYKDPVEKWTVMRLCAGILSTLLDYLPKLMTQFLCDSPLIRALLNGIAECAVMNDVSNETSESLKEHVDSCSLELLNLLWRALQRQPFYLIHRHESLELESQLLIGIQEMVMHVGAKSGKPDYIIAIMGFIDGLMSPEHQLAAIEILSLIIEDHSDIDSHIFAALQWEPALASVFRHTLVEILYYPLFHIGDELKTSLLKLLRKSVVHAEPNIGFFLLGVDVNKLDFGEDVRSVLHGLVDNAANIPTSFLTLLTLMSDPRLSTPTLRYLRCSKFFQAYVREQGAFEDLSFEDLSYFLRCLAVELKTDGGLNTASDLVQTCFGRLEEVLSMIQMESHSTEMPDLEFFDANLVVQAISACEFVDPELKTRLIRVEMLDGMLKEEVSKLEKSTVLRLRKTVHTEAKDILTFARTLNACRQKEARKLLVFDGWRQVVEVIMLTPQVPMRAEFVANILRMILVKVLNTSGVTDYLHRMAAESTLTACAVWSSSCQQRGGPMLNNVINQICEWIASAQAPKVRGLLYAGLLYCVNLLQAAPSADTIAACQNSFPLILDLLCRDCWQGQGTGKMQALYLMGEIIRCTTNRGLGATSGSGTGLSAVFPGEGDQASGGSYLDSSRADIDPNESIGNLSIRNNTFTTDVDKGFSSARLKVSRSAARNTIMNCVFTNGFLSTIIESLGVIDDMDLVSLLTKQISQTGMMAYFVFEAKMSMLTRLAASGLKGVLYLLDLNVVKRLTDMKVFELHNYQSEVGFEQLTQDRTEDQSVIEVAKQQDSTLSQRSLSESLYTQVFKLFHTMIDSAPKNVMVVEQILHFIRVHDESVSKVLGQRIFVERPDNSRLSALLLTSLMSKLALHLTTSPISEPFSSKKSLKANLYNIVRVQAEQNILSEVGIRLVKQTLLFLYYYSMTFETSGPQKGLARRAVLSKKLELDSLLRTPNENVSLGVILQIVADCAESIVKSQLREKKAQGQGQQQGPVATSTPKPAVSSVSVSLSGCIPLSDRVITDIIVILEVGLSLIYFHCELFLRDMEKRNASEEFRKQLNGHIEAHLVKPVNDACKRIVQSEYIETLLLKIRKLSLGSKTNANVLLSSSFSQSTPPPSGPLRK